MSNGYFRKFCGKCRYTEERAANCSRCGGVRDGTHASYCRNCYNEYSREWDHKNVDLVKAKTRRFILKKKYGMTKEDWDALLAAQGGGCAVCGAWRTQLNVDHCHTSGKVRSILCSNCNVALGMTRDNPELLRALADYLERHGVLRANSDA